MGDKKKTWYMHDGAEVPDAAVSPFDKKKEKVLVALAKKCEKLANELLLLKKEMYTKGDQLYTERLANKGLTDDVKKGNYTFFSYDKSLKLEMNVQESIMFGDEIHIAQKKLNEYIEAVTASANSDIQQLIHNAFKTRKGSLDKARVLSLFSLKIEHPLWKEAMDLIRESIQTNDSRRYGTISKQNTEGEYKVFNLNFSSI
jgi:hypothetical protein